MVSTQAEREFGWQQEKYSLVEERELGELDKNVTSPVAVYSNPLA